jgi:serine/threonine protein kinase
MLDLTPYGIRLTLSRKTRLEAELSSALLNKGSFSRSQAVFVLPSGTYSQGSFMGKGTYGESFQAIHSTENTVSLVKVIRLQQSGSEEFIKNTIKECIINILLERLSVDQPYGPYVPRFYEVAYDDVRGLVLIRMERLHGVLADLYNGSTPAQNNYNVLETLGDLSAILDFFYSRVQFNHRDLKSDNVMYNIVNVGGKDKIVIKLIDFGFSCLTWEGQRISGASYFPLKCHCYIPWRDLSQFVYEIYRSYKNRFSPQIQAFLQDLQTFDVDGKTCRMYEGCNLGRKLTLTKWRDTYDFLNKRRIRNPKCIPEQLHRDILKLLGHKGKKTPTPLAPTARREPTAEIKKCLPEQVLNPKTRRCVRRDGAVGRKIIEATYRRTVSPASATRRQARATRRGRKATKDLKPCKAHQVRNPATRRCRNKPKQIPACPPTKIRNPRTGRCIGRNTKAGQLAEAAQGVRKLEEFFQPRLK